VGGIHSNEARSGLPSHPAWAMGAFVWRSPTASELCNSHREEQQLHAAPPSIEHRALLERVEDQRAAMSTTQTHLPAGIERRLHRTPRSRRRQASPTTATSVTVPVVPMS